MYTSFDNGKGDINAMKMKNLQERIYQNNWIRVLMLQI